MTDNQLIKHLDNINLVRRHIKDDEVINTLLDALNTLIKARFDGDIPGLEEYINDAMDVLEREAYDNHDHRSGPEDGCDCAQI